MAVRGPQSHKKLPRHEEMFLEDIGVVQASDAAHLYKTLRPYFMSGSYDLLRKNCNNFSDIALFVLTGARMPRQYQQLEAIVGAVDAYTGLVQQFTGGMYKPNPK